MNTLCVCQCGRKKIWSIDPDAGPTVAEKAYIGTPTKKIYEYAQVFYPSSWCILSAKHGFLWPDEIVPKNYDVLFNNPRTNPLRIEDLLECAKRKHLFDYDSIVVLAPKEYVYVCLRVFRGKELIAPLKNVSGYKDRSEILDRAINSRTPILGSSIYWEEKDQNVNELKNTLPENIGVNIPNRSELMDTNSFENIWQEILRNLKPGMIIKNWTVLKGYFGDDMTVAEVVKNRIIIGAPNAQHLQSIPKSDFLAVWKIWPDYNSRKIERHEIRDITRFSKYIISVFHWLEKHQ
jgi:hypothetical protein